METQSKKIFYSYNVLTNLPSYKFVFRNLTHQKKKMNHPDSPSAQEVLDSIKNLPTNGTVDQDAENGLLYLDLDDNWIFNALTVLRNYGYTRPPFFVYPPFPVGAHIKIVTKREAEDYRLFGKKEEEVSHLIGTTVDFEVVKAHMSYPRIKKYDIEARYKIRVASPELSRIRKELTGLGTGPNNEHFVILVGLKIPYLNGELEKQLVEEFEMKLGPDAKHEELDEDDDEDYDTNGSDNHFDTAMKIVLKDLNKDTGL